MNIELDYSCSGRMSAWRSHAYMSMTSRLLGVRRIRQPRGHRATDVHHSTRRRIGACGGAGT